VVEQGEANGGKTRFDAKKSDAVCGRIGKESFRSLQAAAARSNNSNLYC